MWNSRSGPLFHELYSGFADTSCLKDSTDGTAAPVTGETEGGTTVASVEHKGEGENIGLNYLRKILFFGMITGAVTIYIKTRKAQSKMPNYKSVA